MDRDGTRLTYAHYNSRVSKSSLLEVLFNRAVYVERDREYRICVVLEKCGCYPLGTASMVAGAHGVHFRFGASNDSAELNRFSIRDGFIRGVVFSLWTSSTMSHFRAFRTHNVSSYNSREGRASLPLEYCRPRQNSIRWKYWWTLTCSHRVRVTFVNLFADCQLFLEDYQVSVEITFVLIFFALEL